MVIGQLWLSCSVAIRMRSHWITAVGMNYFPHSYFLLLHNCALKKLCSLAFFVMNTY